MKKQTLAVLIGLSSTFLLTACGGSSSASNTAAATNKVVYGSIDGFGSVIVNGARYNTDNTTFSINESGGTQADLQVGQVITLLGDSNGVASNIIYDLDLKGPATAIDTAANTFTVLGQTVSVSNFTTYKKTSWPLTDGQSVEVSGYINGETLIASFVELNTDTDVELSGKVTNFSEVDKTFSIRGQQISYSSLTELDLDDQLLTNDLQVEVEGTLEGGVLVATEIEADDDVFENGTELEVAGIISGFDNELQMFVVNGTQVTWNDNTDFDDISASALTDNLTVEIEGTVNSAGVLVAEEIEISDDANISIEATISDLSAIDTFTGTITVLGLEIAVGLDTRMSDDDENPNFNAMFNFSDLSIGDKISLDIAGDATNGYRAEKLELDFGTENTSEVEIEIPASLIDLVSNTILGIQFEVATGVTINVLDNLAADAEIEIEGTINGEVLTINSITVDD
ncbi:MAG: hypothetical protein CMI14_04460 [Oleispira sp.]|nr:hypothetical protein [Oleispira sp.]